MFDLRPPTYLSAGAHLTPDDGACLMEAVSVAADQPWSDTPPCTHPLLAHLARTVNDALSDVGRQRLLELAPALAGAHGDDADTTAQIAYVVTAEALSLRPSLLLTHFHRVAAATLSHQSTRVSGRVWARLFERGPACRGIEAAVTACTKMPTDTRDDALVRLLRVGLEAATTTSALSRPMPETHQPLR
jgi:hypothetical protein